MPIGLVRFFFNDKNKNKSTLELLKMIIQMKNKSNTHTYTHLLVRIGPASGITLYGFTLSTLYGTHNNQFNTLSFLSIGKLYYFHQSDSNPIILAYECVPVPQKKASQSIVLWFLPIQINRSNLYIISFLLILCSLHLDHYITTFIVACKLTQNKFK